MRKTLETGILILAVTAACLSQGIRKGYASSSFSVRVQFLSFVPDSWIRNDYILAVELEIPSVSYYNEKRTDCSRYTSQIPPLEFSIDASWIGLNAKITIVTRWHLDDVLIDINPNPADGRWGPFYKPASALIVWYVIGDSPVQGSADGNDDGYLSDLTNDAYIQYRVATLENGKELPDTTPPVTIVEYDYFWRNADFSVALRATDDLSGVAETYYKINAGPTKTVSIDGQPRITTEGASNTLEYWSVDNAGNEEFPHKILTGIKLDKTAPTIGIPSRNPLGDAQPEQPVEISVNVTDPTSEVENVTLYYSLDNGTTWDPLPMAFDASASLYGATIPSQHAGVWVRFEIIAYDHAGNNATKDGGEPDCVYRVISEFSSFLVPALLVITLPIIIIYGKKRYVKHAQT
jgi:hypothetical protein